MPPTAPPEGASPIAHNLAPSAGRAAARVPLTDAPDPAACERLLARWAQADAAPWLHQEVARRMADRLQFFRERPSRWLDWHGWAGGSVEAMAQALPQARRDVAEPTSALVQRSRQQAKRAWWRRSLGLGDAVPVRDCGDWPATSVDMLWANMVLHQVADADALLKRWHGLLAPEGFVMFSTLGPDTLRPLRDRYAARGWAQAMAPLVDMHDIGDAMVRAGFADPVMDQETLNLSWSSAEAALAELRTIGANLSRERCTGLRTPRWREQLLEELRGLGGPDGRISLRFELVYGHAFKGQPRPAPGEPVPISLAGLRQRRAAGR